MHFAEPKLWRRGVELRQSRRHAVRVLLPESRVSHFLGLHFSMPAH